ncbi:MAG: SUMF1/EgtB/PvdO family nonheme iron enzyme [Nitrosomonas sp.]|uniref:SUMF1/EgtB/PvdO family nonheme iron enzyme n=1 Tax=Nitrosomonas sp. TaxID=42353 RepID=UPI0025E97868|nr:SUMF1/EgtB/PvdO family nonheme iron enzyme [Nitrosomonas sp.]MBY0474656.1 SUMF1/EgtB/PvdO family nonheme iron enzyme [Nitrosomonas sp.]
MSDIFIGYSRSDLVIAEQLVQRLRQEGWGVFIDKQTHVGRRWHREIERELHDAKAVVVLWSAVSRDSDFVLEEAEYGKRKNILFPAFIEAVECPYGFSRIQAADLVGWNNQPRHSGFSQLLDSLRIHLNGELAKPAQPNARHLLTTGQTFRDKLQCGGEGPLMMVIPAGRFLMGSPNRDSERPQHEVQITQPFALGVYVVTFDEYDLFCRETRAKKPSDNHWGRENRPVINVPWQDAQEYCAWLSKQSSRRYRLPSEAEWEYACRSGTETPYHTGENITQKQANFAGEQTLPVGSFPPNAFGLYDMHGNVWEWCQDEWHDSYQGAPSDGSSWEDGGNEARVLRGGSWNVYPDDVRASVRYDGDPVDRDDGIGFRVLCSSPIE